MAYLSSVQRKRIAERGRFELPIPEGITVFETAAFDHSATSPNLLW
jgi:hypothetical protein